MRNSIKKMFNVGWLIERARYCIGERTFAEEWIRINRRVYGSNLLQQLFNRDDDSALRRRRPRLIITERDAFIVATVIQWLGTNIGFGFLQETVEKFGWKLVPTDRAGSLRDWYHKAFSPEDNEASAWFNIKAEENPKQGKVRFKLRTPPFKRKHLYRYLPKGYGTKVCIRCGQVYDYKRLEPDCYPPKLPIRIKRIKSMK